MSILNRKWRRACREWQPAVEAFQSLSEASGEEQCAKWLADALHADEERMEDVTAMDIYDVSKQQHMPYPSGITGVANQILPHSAYQEGERVVVDPKGRRRGCHHAGCGQLDLERNQTGGTEVSVRNVSILGLAHSIVDYPSRTLQDLSVTRKAAAIVWL